MKIHVVQKGDTLWTIAEQYGADFEELKMVNTHVTNPDLIMPGMKIKIPSNAVQAKSMDQVKESAKEKKKEEIIPSKEIQEESITAAPIVDQEMIRQMVRDIVSRELPALVRRMLQEMQPEMVHQIKVDLNMDLHKKTEEVKKYEKKVPIEQMQQPQQKAMPSPPHMHDMISGIPCPPQPPGMAAPYHQSPNDLYMMHHQSTYQDPVQYGGTPTVNQAAPIYGAGTSTQQTGGYTGAYGDPYHTPAQYPVSGQPPMGLTGVSAPLPAHHGFWPSNTQMPQGSPSANQGEGCGCTREEEDVMIEDGKAKD